MALHGFLALVLCVLLGISSPAQARDTLVESIADDVGAAVANLASPFANQWQKALTKGISLTTALSFTKSEYVPVDQRCLLDLRIDFEQQVGDLSVNALFRADLTPPNPSLSLPVVISNLNGKAARSVEPVIKTWWEFVENHARTDLAYNERLLGVPHASNPISLQGLFETSSHRLAYGYIVMNWNAVVQQAGGASTCRNNFVRNMALLSTIDMRSEFSIEISRLRSDMERRIGTDRMSDVVQAVAPNDQIDDLVSANLFCWVNANERLRPHILSKCRNWVAKSMSERF